MKKGTIIDFLLYAKNQEIKDLTEKLLCFLDDFFYYYDMMNNTNYNEIFYYLYIEKTDYTYIDIAYFVQKGHTMQIYRVYKKIENFIYEVIKNEKKYEALKEWLIKNALLQQQKCCRK